MLQQLIQFLSSGHFGWGEGGGGAKSKTKIKLLALKVDLDAHERWSLSRGFKS